MFDKRGTTNGWYEKVIYLEGIHYPDSSSLTFGGSGTVKVNLESRKELLAQRLKWKSIIRGTE